MSARLVDFPYVMFGCDACGSESMTPLVSNPDRLPLEEATKDAVERMERFKYGTNIPSPSGAYTCDICRQEAPKQVPR